MDAFRKSELEELEEEFYDLADIYQAPDRQDEPTADEILGHEAMFHADQRLRQIRQAARQTSVGFDDDRVRPLDFG